MLLCLFQKISWPNFCESIIEDRFGDFYIIFILLISSVSSCGQRTYSVMVSNFKIYLSALYVSGYGFFCYVSTLKECAFFCRWKEKEGAPGYCPLGIEAQVSHSASDSRRVTPHHCWVGKGGLIPQ